MKARYLVLAFLGLSSFGSPLDLSAERSEGTQIQLVVKESFSDFFNKTEESLKKWANEDSDVMAQFAEFSQFLEQGLSKKLLAEADAIKVLDAVSFAAEKHRLQLRKNPQKTPYIIHPLGVATQIIKIGQVYDRDILIAALLHDTLEDTTTTAEEITSSFGKKVAGYVVEMTDDKRLSSKERKKQQIIHALHQSKEVAIIKFSDKLHNLNTLMKDPPEGWTEERMDQYFQWAQAVVENLPAANESLKSAVHNSIAKYWEMQQS